MIAGIIAYLITQSILIAMIAAMIAFFLFMVWPEKRYIDFVCSEWIPPSGGSKCNECNQLDSPCTEYRCHSLGSLCQFINKGTGNELCVSKPENPTAPDINPLTSTISEGFEYKDVHDNGFTIANKTADDGCIPAFSTVNFGITVEPFSRCRFDVDPLKQYEEMTEYFGWQGNRALPAHRMDLFFPSTEAFKNHYNLTEEQIKEYGKVDLYVKCKTPSGKTNPTPYHIKTCVSPGPDLTPPRIIVTDPMNNGFLKYGIEEIDMKLYVTEPSECRWDVVDKEFTDMENTMECETSLDAYTRWGLQCNTTLTGLLNNSRFYFRCMDTSEKQNVMKESFIYQLTPSPTPLEITDFQPEDGEVITDGFEPVSVRLRIQTEGGAESGVSMCNWTMGNYWDKFRYDTTQGIDNVSYEVGSRIHEYILSSTQRGRYDITYYCMDLAGNVANATTSFKVKIDSFGPSIIRIIHDRGLKVTTAEKASCRYSFERKTKFDNATEMTGDGFEHFADWRIRTYFIQCEDEHGNKGGKTEVRPLQLLN
jgi:hypothetical protein